MTKFQKQMMTIAAIGALSAVTALPAMAGEATPYASIRMSTFWNINEKADSYPAAQRGTNQGYDEHLQGNARVGINFKDANLTGKVELGATTGANPNIRLMYGAWDFGSGKLVVGQDWTRYYLASASVARDENVFNGIGSLWDARLPQIRLDMKNGLYVSFIQPAGNVAGGEQETAVTSYSIKSDGTAIVSSTTQDRDLWLPKVNVGYAGKAGNLNYNVGVVAQTYKLVGKYDTAVPAVRTEVHDQINSYLAYLNGTVAMGDTKVTYNLSYAQNPAEMGFTGRLARGTVAKNSDDVMGFEGYLQLTQKLSPSLSVNVGTGYVYDRGENSAATAKISDNKVAAFINFPITLAKNVSVTPEFYYEDQLSETYTAALAATPGKSQMYQIGAKWQMDF